VGSNARTDALCSSCSLPEYLKRWPAALYEAGRSALMSMKGSKIPRIELNTVHLYQHHSMFMPNKLQYTWRGDYCERVRPAQLPVLTEVQAPSLLEQHLWCIPHRDRAGYDSRLRNWQSFCDCCCAQEYEKRPLCITGGSTEGLSWRLQLRTADDKFFYKIFNEFSTSKYIKCISLPVRHTKMLHGCTG
jgi:hypothetical protein